MSTSYSSNLPELIADLRTIEQRADAKLRAINVRGARDLLKIARGVVHVRSGDLRDSLFVEGPFDITTGTFEARVISNLPYAQFEIDKGGEHDYAARTIEDGQDVIDQIANDMEQAIIGLIEGTS